MAAVLAGIGMCRSMPRQKVKILCVDDHWNALSDRKVLLEENGYEVLEASGGLEGLEMFRSHPVDAVVLDYQMPGMPGDVVAAKMKRINSQVPIMLLSAYGPLPKSKLGSVDSFLAEPQPATSLLSCLHELLDEGAKPFFCRWLDRWRNHNLGLGRPI